MTDATTEFLQELAARGHEPALAKVTGTLRFDLRDGGARAARWLSTIRYTAASSPDGVAVHGEGLNPLLVDDPHLRDALLRRYRYPETEPHHSAPACRPT
jgi:hypothetical protein